MQIREKSFGFLIQVLARRIDARMKERLRDIDVDVKMFPNLITLLAEDGINQRQLGEKQSFPEYFVSRNIDTLVNAGLVERRPDPNSRRTQLIFLTDKGRGVASKLPEIIRENNEASLQGLSEDEKATLMGLLQKVGGYS